MNPTAKSNPMFDACLTFALLFTREENITVKHALHTRAHYASTVLVAIHETCHAPAGLHELHARR